MRLPQLYTLNSTVLYKLFVSRFCFEVNIEADSNDITEHPYDRKPMSHAVHVVHQAFREVG